MATVEAWGGLIDLVSGGDVNLTESVITELKNHLFLDDDGKPTELGKAKAEDAKRTLEMVRKGVPLSERTERDPNRVISGANVYKIKVMGHDAWVTYPAWLLFLEFPHKKLANVLSYANYTKDNRKSVTLVQERFPEVLKKKKDWRPLEAIAYQRMRLEGPGIIVLATKKRDFMTPIQAKAYDYFKANYTSAAFFVCKSKKISPVMIKTSNNAGIDGAVGLIAPINLARWTPPEMEEKKND